MTNKIKVLIIDDSALARQTLREIMNASSFIEVTDTASDPYHAVSKMQKNIPDVITLDIEMPRMDGLTFLRKLMAQHPIPVVVISSLTEKGADAAIKALEYGAVDVFAKPKINTKELLKQSAEELCEKIKAASLISAKKRGTDIYKTLPVPEPKYTADEVILKKIHKNIIQTTNRIIVIGASTGGTEAIKELLMGMPPDAPGIVIVQHMPELFTKQFAKRLDEVCQISVKEAANGDRVLKGNALIAPGGKHLLINRRNAAYCVEIRDGLLVNRHKPSVDVLFRSVACCAGKNAIGVILTGMGNDGAQGLLEMKNEGAYTIAQDEQSSVVFGMPKEAIKLNATLQIIPLKQISSHIINSL